ncbi:Retrovirus-related Pol polyprotein from transposon TNT 1-94, partial [Linum perenne]
MAETSQSRRGLKVSSSHLEVEKFDGTNNFGVWQGEVLDLLAMQDLDLTLDEKLEELSETEWAKLNRQACGTIRSCLGKDQKYPFMKITMAKELWDKLEAKYMQKSVENKLYLKKKLFRFDYKQGTSMVDHLNDFNKIITDLQNLDVDIADDDKALLLLNSLPESYEFLTTTLLHGKSEISFDDVSNALMNNEVRRKDKGSYRESSSDALIVRGRTNSRKKGEYGRSRSKSRGKSVEHKKLGRDECAYCRKKGHWKKDCPIIKERESKANMASDDDSDRDDALTVSLSVSHPDEWILDSACSHHMCPDKGMFSELEEFEGRVVYMGNNTTCTVKGNGSVKLKMFDGIVRTLTDVRYVPGLKKHLISLGALEDKGFRITMESGQLKVTQGALVVMKGTRRANLYFLKRSTKFGEAAVANSKMWHMRLGHTVKKPLQTLVNPGVLKGAKSGKIEFCEHCVYGKHRRVKFGTAIHRTNGVLDYVHTDVWGPTKHASLGGRRWFVTFIDDFSRRVWTYPMKHKDEVMRVFLEWKKMVENQTGRKIKKLRSDNGGEYKSDPFLEICREEGIVRHFTVPGKPQQNGVAERMNQTLIQKVRCMLSQAGLTRTFWAEALSYAVHLVNRLPTTATGGKAPLEVWSGEPVKDYDQLHIFGCPAYYHVQDSKLDPRAKKAKFMGFSIGVKGYRLWCPESKKIVNSRDVVFDELVMSSTREDKDNEAQREGKHVIFPLVKEAVKQVEENPQEVEEDSQEEEQNPQEDEPESIARNRPRREIRRPTRYEDMVAYALPTIEGVPNSFREAVQSPEHVKWQEAMKEEMKSLEKNKTWSLVQLPSGKRAIGCKWVFAKKDDKSGIRFKARLVAKGYAQKEGIDYNEIFSPVVKHSSIRILLALVAQFDLKLEQLDVKTAFLHGDLEEEIYMAQPDGFQVAGKEKWVCNLKKSLYGLKQSPRQWYKRFDLFMTQHGFTRSPYDHCVYFRQLGDGSFIYLLLYVDDMLIASKSKVEIDKLKVQLSKEFEMKDLGEAKKILGMEIKRDRKEAMCPSTKEEKKDMEKVPYANAIGALMYAMVCTRPDISQAV